MSRLDRDPAQMSACVTRVSCASRHTFSKPNQNSIRLVAGFGVEGDAHFGRTVQHRSRVARDPSKPNLRQVHLIHAELFDELSGAGFSVSAGDLGENITTLGLDLLGLPRGARLCVGSTAVMEVTGLRDPCVQLDRFQRGLTKALLGRDCDGRLIRKAGVMGVVVTDGEVRQGDWIVVDLPPQPYQALEPV